MTDDPFAHHPELRALILDPDRSTFRRFDPQSVPDLSGDPELESFLIPAEEREASRRQVLGLVEGDLWVFGYGSLMWDPALRFAEVRRAHVGTHALRFILKDTFGARGDRDRPGLMAALDEGDGCDGLVFRIPAAEVAAESEILWRREMAGRAYRPTFVTADTRFGPVTALAFEADAATPAIVRDIPRDLQVRYFATGMGFLGSSLDYLTNIATQLAALGIENAEVDCLVRDARAYIAAGRVEGPAGQNQDGGEA